MEKIIYIMRGVSGSGKSTLARTLANGVAERVCSTDDFFIKEGVYAFDASMLNTAHEWNRNRVEELMESGFSPLVVDNTNTMPWEAKPYVLMAQENGYRVEFREPETAWKFDAAELTKRNTHGVPHSAISRMLQRYVPMEKFTVEAVLRSKGPGERSDDKNKGRDKGWKTRKVNLN